MSVKFLLKLLLLSFTTSSWNLENWKASTRKNKTQLPQNLVFSLHKSFPILWGKNYFENVILSFRLMSSDWNMVNSCSIEFEWTWFSKAVVQQSFTKYVFLKTLQNSHENTWDLWLKLKETPVQMFSCEFCKIFENLYCRIPLDTCFWIFLIHLTIFCE